MALENFYPIFGRRLAAVRKAKGLTQVQVAEAVKMSRASVANVEAGKQRVFLDQVYDLASAVGLDGLNDLLPEFVQKQPGERIVLKLTGATNLSREQERSLEAILKEAMKK